MKQYRLKRENWQGHGYRYTPVDCREKRLPTVGFIAAYWDAAQLHVCVFENKQEWERCTKYVTWFTPDERMVDACFPVWAEGEMWVSGEIIAYPMACSYSYRFQSIDRELRNEIEFTSKQFGK